MEKNILGCILRILAKANIIDNKVRYINKDGNKEKIKYDTIISDIPKIDKNTLSEIWLNILLTYPDTDIGCLDEAETINDLIYIIKTSNES